MTMAATMEIRRAISSLKDLAPHKIRKQDSAIARIWPCSDQIKDIGAHQSQVPQPHD